MPRPRPTEPPTIAAMGSMASLLLCVPGAILYVAILILVASNVIELRGQLLPSMLLALSGFGLFLLALAGLVATLLQGWRLQKFRGLEKCALVVQAGIVLAMLILWVSGWQIG